MVVRLRDTLLLVGGSEERRALRGTFEREYDLLEAENIHQAVMLLEQNRDCIAAVLSDTEKPEKKEAELLVGACCDETGADIPLVIFVDEDEGAEDEELAFGIGAADVVHKPFLSAALYRRIQVIIDLYLQRAQLAEAVKRQAETIRRSNQVMLDALSAIIEHRSTESGRHVLRIRSFTRILLEEVAANFPEFGLTEQSIHTISSASALHDIGKISVPDAILNKPGKLTAEEYEVMKCHTTVGSELVQHLEGIGDEEFLRYAYNIALYHHERWDGGGYPVGLKGDEIPICAQVVGIADAYDALTTERVYKKALSCTTAVNMILNGECGAFSPGLCECFKRVRDRFAALAIQYADGLTPQNEAITAPLPKPMWSGGALSSAQLLQVKYQTLMHYTGDTVIEVNLDDNVYHVMYNPNVVAEAAKNKRSVRALLGQILNHVHPDDMAAAEELRNCLEGGFFTSEQRRKRVFLRFYEAGEQNYHPYRVTLLRLNTRNMERRAALLMFHYIRAEGEEEVGKTLTPPSDVRRSPALQGLLSSAIRCRSDKGMTLCGGEEELFILSGYTTEDIARSFGGRYLDMVCQEDRAAVSETMELLQRDLSRGELEYRLQCKDGAVRWVMDKCRAYLEEDGTISLYHALTDHSRIKENYRNYEDDIERNRTIIENSNGIVFEWDMGSDTMYCSPKWEEHFGYAPVSKNYSSQMGIATHFHPDDLPTVREAINKLKTEYGSISVDVRIADSNAKYLWTHISGTGQLDSEGKLKRIVGILQDVDAIKRAELALREKAERDPLTRLLNKDTSRQTISDAMSRGEKDLSALMVLDLDNFKHINDTYGHLYGDAVLTQVGAALKKLFRENDIIGRVGGDEFVVYMRNIPAEELLHRRCQMMLDTFSTLLREMAPELNVSCSIGAAFYPCHGEDYITLFRHADEALYRAKTAGKNTYTVYDPSLERGAMVERAATAIDSDTQPGMAEGSFVRFVFQRLYESRDILSTIDELLRYVGQQLNVDRVYIFENNADNTACSNTFEWCGEGIPSEKENLQNVSYIDDIAGWPDVFDEKGIFYCTDITTLAPQFRAVLEPQGIKSMLQCAIYDDGVFRGYVGFDDCTIHCLWTKEQVDVLQFMAQVLAMFLLKKRTQDSLRETVSLLYTLLDRQQEWLYVIDPATYELQFVNAAARKLSPHIAAGMVCHEALHRRDVPCEGCPARDLPRGQKAESCILNHNLRIHGCVQAEKLDWKGQELCLMTVKEAQ